MPQILEHRADQPKAERDRADQDGRPRHFDPGGLPENLRQHRQHH